MKKRFLSIILVLALCLTMLPTAAFAEGTASAAWDGVTTTKPSGSGSSESDPYLISNAAELAWLATIIPTSDYDKYYVKLTADIVLNDGTFDANGSFTKTGESTTSTPNGWTPISAAHRAAWCVDGNNKSISGLYINSSNQEDVGLFAYLYGGSYIRNLTIKNSYVCLMHSENHNGSVGIFAGHSYNTEYTNCVGENNILSTDCYLTGGIVGWANYDTFNSMHTSGSIKSTKSKSMVGGLVGRASNDIIFKNCWNETNIENAKENYTASGGLVGDTDGSVCFYNCANLGSLNGGSRMGGIVGYGGSGVIIKNCYGLNDISNYKGEWDYNFTTQVGRDIYNVGTLSGLSALVSLSYAEDGFKRNDNGEDGAVPHFTGKGKLTENGNDNELLNALNDNLYKTDAEPNLKKWVVGTNGYPLPTGEIFVDDTEYYGVWLNGVRISERNYADIFENGLASYDKATNTLTLHDGLVVTNPYEKSLLYTDGASADLNICVDGNITFHSGQNIGGGSYIINLDGSSGGGGNLKIYAPEGKSATVSLIGDYSEYGIDMGSLTLDGDVCLTISTGYYCFTFDYNIKMVSSEAVLDAVNKSGDRVMLNTSDRVTLPSTNPQKLYEGTGDSLNLVNSFTTSRYNEEEEKDEPYMYPHIRIAPDSYALVAALPSSYTVSMETANAENAVLDWVTTEVRKISGITEANSTITVSDVESATAGSYTNASGANGGFTVTVTVTKDGISKTRTIPGIITATTYVAPTIAAGIQAGTVDADGQFTADIGGTFTSGDNIVFAVTYTANGAAVKSLSGTVTCFEQSKDLVWNEANNCYLTDAFTCPKAQTAPYEAGYSIGGSGEYTQQTGSMNVSVQGMVLTASDFDFSVPTDLTYDGNAKEAQVTFNGDSSRPCGDVTVKYYDQDDRQVTEAKAAGTYKVKIDVAAGDYSQAATELTDSSWTFTIGAKALSSSNITVAAIADQTYCGDALTPDVTVNDGMTMLVKDNDYTVSYMDNTDVGTATATITGTGNYTGTLTKTWRILPKVIDIDKVMIENKAYTGTSEAEGSVVFSDYVAGHEPDQLGTDYTISASFIDKNVGNSKTVNGTVTLINSNYCFANGEMTASFETEANIEPKSVTATVTVEEKIYDGTTTATVAAIVTNGPVDGDSITIAGLTGTFDNVNAGTDKTVTINVSGKSITGTESSNYDVIIPTTAVGNITKKTATITAMNKIAYIGSTAPDLSNPVIDTDYTISGLVGDDTPDSSVTVTLTVNPDMSKVGEYAIVPTITGTDNRYDFAFVNGKLNVYNRPSSASSSITSDKDTHGEITVSPKNASKGTTVTITVTPDPGYTLETLTVLDKDGKEIELTNEGNGKYTFKMPSGKVTVNGTFMEDNSVLNFFVDVTADKYYYDAVLWAAENGITGGVDENHFAPNLPCTRAQIVTFLWRAAGSPMPTSISSFTDVPSGVYYAKAVSWAVENGITTGVTADTFCPDKICTRAQAVAFLFRDAVYRGMDGVTLQELLSGYADAMQVPSYGISAFNWALGNGVVAGYDGNLMPNDNCTRAQIVTMLYRLMSE